MSYRCSEPARTHLCPAAATKSQPLCGRHIAARTAAASPRAPIYAQLLPPMSCCVSSLTSSIQSI